MTIQLHMDSHEGTYTKSFNAKVEATFPGIVELDKTAFYHLGGGQPADKGVILWKGNQAQVIDVKKKNRIRHFVEGDLPEIGEIVEGKIDWKRRYSHMRMHTSQHLVSALYFQASSLCFQALSLCFQASSLCFPASVSQHYEHCVLSLWRLGLRRF